MAEILLLEDQSFTAKLITTVLTDAGHTVTAARDGRAGLSAFTEKRPDVLITDLIMPEVDGLEVIRTVRALSTTIPIIAISGGEADGRYDYLEIAMKLGATQMIRKPVSREELLAAVDRALLT